MISLEAAVLSKSNGHTRPMKPHRLFYNFIHMEIILQRWHLQLALFSKNPKVFLFVYMCAFCSLEHR